MKRYLVEIYCPVTARKYDAWLPAELTAGQAIQALARQLRVYEDNPALFGDAMTLQLYREDGTALAQWSDLRGNDVRSGDRLTLI